MNDQQREPEFVVTEGRAYHAGDVVLLRAPIRSGEQLERVRASLEGLEEKTGVVFVVMDESVEVVEPVALS